MYAKKILDKIETNNNPLLCAKNHCLNQFNLFVLISKKRIKLYEIKIEKATKKGVKLDWIPNFSKVIFVKQNPDNATWILLKI